LSWDFRLADCRDAHQQPPTKRRASGSQSTPLLIGQPNPRGSQLRLQDTILFAPVTDDLVQLALKPTDQ
jgi:hypothetical protein